MGLVLITAAFGKEKSAMMEILDCILHLDPSAKFAELGLGGLLLLETSINSDAACIAINDYPTSFIFTMTPVDIIVNSDLMKISDTIRGLIGLQRCKVAVKCRRRGRAINSSSEVEVEIGRMLKTVGFSIDLEKPELVVQIDIIGKRTTISVRPPTAFFKKRRANQSGQA